MSATNSFPRELPRSSLNLGISYMRVESAHATPRSWRRKECDKQDHDRLRVEKSSHKEHSRKARISKQGEQSASIKAKKCL